MNNIDLADVARRPGRYWLADGVPELVMGLLWISWGAAWLVGDTLPHGSTFRVFWMLTPALLAGSGVAAVWLIKRIKATLTFPRTGFVEWREPTTVERLLAAGVALVTAAVLAATGMRTGGNPAHAAPVLGVILSLSFVVASLRQRAPHYLAFAGVALATGLALGAIGGELTSVSWMFIVLGAASAVFGAVRLLHFIRTHPVAGAQA